MSATFTIPGVDPSRVSVILKDPTGQVTSSSLESKGAGLFQVTFQPNQNGDFVAEIFVGGSLHQKLPISVKEEEETLQQNIFKPIVFEQFVEEIGSDSKDVKIILKDPTKNELNCQFSVNDGNINLIFTPNQDGAYTAEVWLRNTLIDSLNIDVNSHPNQREKRKKVDLDFPVGDELDPSTLKVIILDPKGKNVDVHYEVRAGTLYISFEPLRGGTHRIQMWISGEMADETEINVRVHQEVRTEQDEEIKKKKRYGVAVNTSASDSPDSITVTLLDPDGEEIDSKFTVTDGNVDVKFKSEPKKVGTYVAHIFHNGHKIAQQDIVVQASEVKEEPKKEELKKEEPKKEPKKEEPKKEEPKKRTKNRTPTTNNPRLSEI